MVFFFCVVFGCLFWGFFVVLVFGVWFGVVLGCCVWFLGVWLGVVLVLVVGFGLLVVGGGVWLWWLVVEGFLAGLGCLGGLFVDAVSGGAAYVRHAQTKCSDSD
ncbi:hypothetical protein RA264_27660, partial [Pseudomonas syringae pv. tagetis]|uniref:hypothetical protein n=1 Tax=Pseudomonas syringae group genomosp. 7 TaxID=251699 RepID=UPI00376FD3AB